MLGQDKLLNTINSYTLLTFPKTSMFLGEVGCGKHTLLDYVSKKFNLETLNITDKISNDYLDDLRISSAKRICYIETSSLSIQNQNTILKFIEEPTENIWIILLCDDKSKLLDTVVNRCIIFEFEKYSIEMLRKFNTSDSDLIYELCTTPGQIKTAIESDLDGLRELCEKIVTKVSTAMYANVLTIVNKINLKDEYDKFDLKLFFKMLILVSYDNYVKTNSDSSYLVYNKVKEYVTRYEKDSRLNLQSLLEDMLSELWKIK